MRTDELWPALGASVADVLLLLDPEGTILYVNRPPAGMAPDEAVGRSVLDVIPASAQSRVWLAIQEVFMRGELRTLELAITRPDGHVRWIQASAGPYRDRGQVVAATVLVRDITSEKATEFALHQLERQLQQVQKVDLLGQLAIGIVHEFANLLAIVRTSVDALVPMLTPHSEERDVAMAIWTASERGRDLSRQVMAYVRTSDAAGEPVDLNAVVEQVVGMLARLLGREIRLQTRLHPAPVRVLAERGQMDQILTNLMVNARDAMPSGGTITIATRLSPRGDEVVLSVIDTGTGMDEVTQRRIFEPFFSTKPPERGTGLGLSTVAIILEMLGGRIAVKSTVGVGSTIDIILPRARDAGSDG